MAFSFLGRQKDNQVVGYGPQQQQQQLQQTLDRSRWYPKDIQFQPVFDDTVLKYPGIVMNAFENNLLYLTEKTEAGNRPGLLGKVLNIYNVDLRQQDLENRTRHGNSIGEDSSQITSKGTFDYEHMIKHMREAVKSFNQDNLIDFIHSHYGHDKRHRDAFMSRLARKFESSDPLIAVKGLDTSCQELENNRDTGRFWDLAHEFHRKYKGSLDNMMLYWNRYQQVLQNKISETDARIVPLWVPGEDEFLYFGVDPLATHHHTNTIAKSSRRVKTGIDGHVDSAHPGQPEVLHQNNGRHLVSTDKPPPYDTPYPY